MSVRRRILTTGSSLLAAATVAATVLVPATPAQAAPAFPFVGGFQLFNVHSGKCLTVTRGGAAGSDVVQSTCRDEWSHLWRMRLVTLTGLFQVQNVRSGRCLSATEGTGRVVQYRCDDAVSRRWRLWDAKGAGFYIRGAASGRCLTVAGGGADENAAALLSTCGPARSRRWDARLSGSTERA